MLVIITSGQCSAVRITDTWRTADHKGGDTDEVRTLCAAGVAGMLVLEPLLLSRPWPRSCSFTVIMAEAVTGSRSLARVSPGPRPLAALFPPATSGVVGSGVIKASWPEELIETPGPPSRRRLQQSAPSGTRQLSPAPMT